jgi:lysyl endopeptidase
MRKFLLILAASAALFAATANAELPRVAGEPAWANEKAAADKRLRLPNYPDADTAHLRFAPMDEGRINEVRTRNSRRETKRLQIGINRDARLEAEGGVQELKLNWQALPGGGKVARFAVTSPGAPAMRLGLNVVNIPSGAELRFVGSAGGDTAVAMTGSDEIVRLRREQPVYWTPVTEGEKQIVEIYLPAGADANLLRFTIDSVSHLIVSPWGKLTGAKIGESQSCERDVSCSGQTTAFVNAKNAVARMLFQTTTGTALCTGTLLNDADTSTQVPYFYSANHCISTQTEASTLTTFWFYESTGCDSGVLDTNNSQQVPGGATLLFNDAAKDGVLLKLNNAPPQGAFFMGWDANTISAGTDFTVIHHPNGDVKKVSLGQVLGFTTLPETGGNFITVGYTNASTEVGSSGSGILTTDSSGAYFLRGGLFAGPASCGNTGNLTDPNNTDYYSRFDQVYPSISQYLHAAAAQPDYTGAWYNTSESGWGLSVIRGPSGLYGIIMYHYNQSANPTWYGMSGGSFNGNVYSAPVTFYSGPWFGLSSFSPLPNPVPVGTASINFTSATTATISYTISGITVTKNIAKLEF